MIPKGKAFYIGVDCEGVACAVGTQGQGLKDSRNYPTAALQATREAAAAAQALFDSGANEVIVWDNHAGSCNLNYDLLPERCKILLGTFSNTRFPTISETAGGVLFIGYHAREATQNAVLAHTFSSVTYQHVKMNGIEVGELEIDAAFAGLHGVPVLFVASDDVCVSQARESFPWIEGVATKQSVGWNSALSLHPAASCKAIYEGVTRACSRYTEMQPYTIPGPIELEIRFKRMDAANTTKLYDIDRKPFRFVDPFTRAGTIRGIEEYMA